jgi:exodeoxyribonuclease VII large subunit
LPATLGEVSVGEMIGLAGRLTAKHPGASIQVLFAATRIEGTPRKSKRRAELERLLDELKARYKEPREVGPLRQVVLVSSEASLAVSDFEKVLPHDGQVRWRLLPVRLRERDSISGGIREAAQGADVDAIVVTRGGGSAAELMPFNSPEVVTAIAEVAAQVPVITALGHFADETASDMVASHRESTPASAAHFVRSRARGQLEARGLQRDTAARTRRKAPLASTRARLEMAIKRVWAYVVRATIIGALIGAGWCGGVLWSSWPRPPQPAPAASVSPGPRSPNPTAPAKATAKPHR